MTRFPLAPGEVIGILGGGQLGRMLSLAAARLGFEAIILSPEAGSSAGRVAAGEIVAAYDDPAALAELARRAAVVTFEFENVPASAIERLAELGCEVAPAARALAIAQDRLEEKTFLAGAGVRTVDFAPVDDATGLAAAIHRLGLPLLLKTRRGGYDGKGQAWIARREEGDEVLSRFAGRPLIAEAPANFRRELAVIGARGRTGEIAVYPLIESRHENGILRQARAPAQASESTVAEAQRIAAALLHALGYVGVIGVELFEDGEGGLLVNEFAPRVHNTGHWTLDGCEVDQFEQHVRAIAGWPLGPTAPLAAVEMTNLLGEEANDWPSLAAEPHARLWLYGKSEARAGRKMGHVNRLSALS